MFTSMKDLIGDVTEQFGLNQRAKIQAIAETYAQIVEPHVLKATKLTTLHNGVLEIDVSVAPLLMELSQYQKVSILKQLKEVHPSIRDIRFRPAPSS